MNYRLWLWLTAGTTSVNLLAAFGKLASSGYWVQAGNAVLAVIFAVAFGVIVGGLPRADENQNKKLPGTQDPDGPPFRLRDHDHWHD